jgi:hypothetical protein
MPHGVSDHHVPIGQFECPSSVTGLGETYPLTASITMVSGKFANLRLEQDSITYQLSIPTENNKPVGGENALLRLIQHLHRHGVLDSVKTGRKAF